MSDEEYEEFEEETTSAVTRVGKPVQYRTLVNDEHQTHAATIVKVWSPTCVNLACLDENGHGYTVYSACYSDDEDQEGTWCWL